MKKGETWSKQLRERIENTINSERYKKKRAKIFSSKSYREKMNKIWDSPNFRRKLRRMALKTWQDPKVRADRLGEIRSQERKEETQGWWTKDRRQEKSKEVTAYFKNHPEARRNLSRKTKAYFKNHPEQARLISEKMKARYKAHPYLRARLSKEKQKYYEEHPEARARLLAYTGGYELKIRVANFYVKSKGEEIIAKTLLKNNIQPNYESIELNFSEMDPVPDFYPKGEYNGEKISNVLVEYYGGHPKSWSNKVRKNRLYKKYHIPVLILTPYELKLENTEDYILKQLVKLSQSKEARTNWLKNWQIKKKRI